MVDEGRVARLLRGVGERVGRLRAAEKVLPDERGDLWLDGVKYLFVTAIEGCIDVAQHIASSDDFGAPDSNADALRLLAAHGVVDRELSESLARAAGFRDVLVHGYADVDDGIVIAALGDVADFDSFAAQVSAWMLADRDE